MVEKKRGISEGVLWVVVGGVICILSLQYSLGSFRAPAPGFVAFLSGILIGGIGAVMIISQSLSMSRTKETIPEESRAISGVPWSRLTYTMVFLIAYAILMDPVGYIVSTFLTMFGLFFDWKRKNWFWSGFFSITVSLSSYIVFEVWLRCQLPHGIFPWW